MTTAATRHVLLICFANVFGVKLFWSRTEKQVQRVFKRAFLHRAQVFFSLKKSSDQGAEQSHGDCGQHSESPAWFVFSVYDFLTDSVLFLVFMPGIKMKASGLQRQPAFSWKCCRDLYQRYILSTGDRFGFKSTQVGLALVSVVKLGEAVPIGHLTAGVRAAAPHTGSRGRYRVTDGISSTLPDTCNNILPLFTREKRDLLPNVLFCCCVLYLNRAPNSILKEFYKKDKRYKNKLNVYMNKADDPAAVVRSQRENWELGLMIVMETWLHQNIPDTWNLQTFRPTGIKPRASAWRRKTCSRVILVTLRSRIGSVGRWVQVILFNQGFFLTSAS